DLPLGLGAPDVAQEPVELPAPEEGAAWAVDPCLAWLGDRVGQRGDEGGEHVAPRLRGGGREVRLVGVGVVAHAPGGGLGAAERALHEEEELEVLAPAEGAVEASALAVVDRLEIAEGALAVVVELATELRDREV